MKIRIIACTASALLILACLAGRVDAKGRGSKRPPVAVYPGARYLAKKSLEYREERYASRAWAFAVKAKFKSVAAFYRDRIGSNAPVSTESKTMYFAVTKHFEVRVDKAEKGWVMIQIAEKEMPETVEPPKETDDDQEGGQAGHPTASPGMPSLPAFKMPSMPGNPTPGPATPSTGTPSDGAGPTAPPGPQIPQGPPGPPSLPGSGGPRSNGGGTP